MNLPPVVFVCGTSADLRAERGGVLDAIQRLSLRSHSMEFFGARTKRPVETCLEEVRKSDIAIVIVGDRYGTLVPGRTIAFSEAEYDEAYRLGKPCLVYFRDEQRDLDEPSPSSESKTESLERWKSVLQDRHTVATFSDRSELAIQVVADLSRVVRDLEARAAGYSWPKGKLHETQNSSGDGAHTATLEIEFKSDVTEGRVTIFEGQKKIYRKAFGSSSRSQLSSDSEQSLKRLHGSIELSPGELHLRIYVWQKGSPTRSAEVTGDILPGSSRHLRICQSGDEINVELI